MVAGKEDILASVMKYIDYNKGAFAVRWPGGAFDTNSVEEWLEPHVTGITAARSRLGEDDLTVVVDVNCFAKRSTNLYRHFEMAGTVAGWFHCLDLPLLDGAQILRFREPNLRTVPIPVPNEDGLRQVAVSVIGRIIE